MAAIDQYIERIADENLRGEIQTELARLMKKKSFGLVFEHHMPDNLLTPEVPIRRGTNVVIRNGKVSDVYEVQSLTDTDATCIQLSTMNEVVLPLADLVAIAQRGDVIYPYLKRSCWYIYMQGKWIVFILTLLIISQTPTIGSTTVIMWMAMIHIDTLSGYL